MKIGIDIRSIGKQRTGSEVVVLELTKNILKIDKENKYILLTDTDDNKVLEYVKENLELADKKNVEIVSIPTLNKFVWAAWSMPRWAYKNHLDIYHTEYILPFFMPNNTKLVTHIHDISFKAYRKFISWKDIFFLDMLIPWTLKRADKIIAISKFTKNEIVKYYKINPGKIEIVYNSTNLSKKAECLTEAEIRKKYNLPEKFVLYVGTLQPRKNVWKLVNAFCSMGNKLKDTELVITGNLDAHNVDSKLKLKNNEKRINFIGFIDTKDKRMIYSLADTLVMPSFYEGFGITPMEAMKENTPTLISDIPVHREIYKDAAFYFDPKSLDELTKKLYTICTDYELRNQLINLGCTRVSFFSWKKSAKDLLRVYKSMSANLK